MKLISKITILILSVWLLASCGGGADSADKSGEKKTNVVTQKVKLDFHIMSKCPFGARVVNTIIPVLEQMGDNIDFNLHYIGREQNGELKSMHGDPEVKGDLQQICANAKGDTKQWIAFLKCQSANWQKIPEGMEECAKSAGIDAAAIKTCVDGEEGKKLLAASFKLSLDKNAKGSPTIFLNDQPYAGGRTEASFGRSICGEFKDAKPDYCANIPEPVKVEVTVVTDKRCIGKTCNPRRFLSFVRNTFEGAEIKTIDYSETEGKALFEKSKQQFLPIAVFEGNVEKAEAGFARLKRRMEKMDSGDYVYPLGKQGRPPWDPKAEICDDGKDNTGNGQVDCDDDTCKSRKICREEIKNRVDLFVMSHCPYGVRTVDATIPVIDHFKKEGKDFDLKIHFIGNENAGQFSSMHGPSEVNEDIRQLCAQAHYGKDYKFMDYISCRNDAYQKNRGREEDNAWESCAKGGISAAVISKCAEGDEGKALISESFKLAGELGITGSPSWLLNNRTEMRARAPQQIKSEFCAANPEAKGCNKEMKVDPSEAVAPVPAGSCGSAGPGPVAPADQAAEIEKMKRAHKLLVEYKEKNKNAGPPQRPAVVPAPAPAQPK
ncbi:MAG: hypothetical protein JXR91_10325 [Deltaproteobacteria bacterium]|nr:hypothetical protein [Deltaproteobacteria bacterium]